MKMLESMKKLELRNKISDFQRIKTPNSQKNFNHSKILLIQITKKVMPSKGKSRNFFKKTQDLLMKLEMLKKMFVFQMPNSQKHSKNSNNINEELNKMILKMMQ